MKVCHTKFVKPHHNSRRSFQLSVISYQYLRLKPYALNIELNILLVDWIWRGDLLLTEPLRRSPSHPTGSCEERPLSWSIGYGEETGSCRAAPKIAIPPFGKLRRATAVLVDWIWRGDLAIPRPLFHPLKRRGFGPNFLVRKRRDRRMKDRSWKKV